MKRSTIGVTLMLSIFGSITVHTMYVEGTKVLAYEREPEEPRVVLIEVQPNILNKIADCESGNRLLSGKAVKGSATHFNEDGTVLLGIIDKDDTGKYQINSRYHQRTAEAMGIDIWTESGNEAYARHLYQKNGTRDWGASASCWSNK